jgi:metal-responsive CopG/Arc/MetJ family transcriptional regulator
MSEVIQVNVSMETETANQLEKMAKEMGYDNRSAFVRWLIRQEYMRRYHVVATSNLPTPPDCEPVKVVTVEPDEA